MVVMVVVHGDGGDGGGEYGKEAKGEYRTVQCIGAVKTECARLRT